MQWRGRRESSNIEDRRGSSGLVAGGGIGAVIIGILYYLLGGNPSSLPTQDQPVSPSERSIDPASDSLSHFVGVVLAETEDVWTNLFQQEGKQYTNPHLVLFSQQINSACGRAGASMGPFYCSLDNKVYIDLSFYRELRNRFGAGGDFAQAYVIAHEVGHHVQNLLGISDKVQQLQQRSGSKAANALSVRLELQADFFAGVWAHYEKERGTLEAGDIEEALTAATAIGDDKIQQETEGRVVPDAFTHGTSKQRAKWFRKGYETGDPNQGDTFNAQDL